MRGLSQADSRADGRETLTDQVAARLDARLERGDARPLAVALSGGGDSLALLDLAAAWAAARGRRLLALTVDHRLSPHGAGWTRRAEAMARAAGADFRALAWEADRPDPAAPGLAAAARRARHALLARAARDAGARVILMAHTADDRAENLWMRAHGSTLGTLRDWAPSPAWPEGRGLMLFRPLLDVRRADLRAYLRAAGLDWIDDPANADPRFLRARARAALAETGAGTGAEAVATPAPCRSAWAGDAAIGLRLPPGTPPRVLAAALVSAGGGDRPPRGERLARLHARLATGETFLATLSGARIEAQGGAALVLRDAGRIAAAPLPLAPGRPQVWDGRFEVCVDAPGWSVAPARGRLARLPSEARAALARRPAAARGAAPVLIRDDGSVTVLAGPRQARDLVAPRLGLALDETPHEKGLTRRPMAPPE